MADRAAAVVPSAPADKLDELMMAMDVVDTLRHQEGLVEKEFAQEGRDATLKERLRRLYESQGLTVDDRILDEGIRALKEARFTYTPTPPSLSRSLALLWIRRKTAGLALVVVLALAVAGVGWLSWSSGAEQRAAEAARIEMSETLPARIDTALAAVLAEARDSGAKAAAEALAADGRAALGRGDAPAARAAASALDDLRGRLARTFDLVIVSRPGERTGVFRVPDVNSSARNYYIVVEAIGADGKPVTMPVTSEEDGTTETVSKWAIRVPKATYDAVARDKADNGIVEDNILAEKPRGTLDPVYRMDVSSGAILSW